MSATALPGQPKRALICGASGQDGAYLARFLLSRGYEVHCTSRAEPNAHRSNLARLGLGKELRWFRMDPARPDEVGPVVAESAPDELYYLAAQSSVAHSFAEPVATFQAAAIGLLNVLEAARLHRPAAKVLHAASGDCFGETGAENPAREGTPFAPRSPYAAAKCAAHHALAANRGAYGQFAASAFLFTHESPLRTETFAVGKTVAAAKRIARGSEERLSLGDVSVVRDWGWAADYVAAMWAILQQSEPADFVIASGRSVSLAMLVEAIFGALGLDWRDHVDVGAKPPRPGDIARQHADPSLAKARLGWSGAVEIGELARRLVGDEAAS
jgi:GDPmannose 4,6-dehydratase